MSSTNGPSTTPRPRPGRPSLPTVAVVLAAALQLVVLVPFTVASGLLAPLWAVVLFYALWVVSVAALVLTARRRPSATPLVPLVNAALLWAAITLGDLVLGWSA